MAINPRRKSDAARRANQVIRSRTVLVMVLLGVCTFVALFWKLYDLQIRQHEDLQEQAVSQQTPAAPFTTENLRHWRCPPQRRLYSFHLRKLRNMLPRRKPNRLRPRPRRQKTVLPMRLRNFGMKPILPED